MKMANLFNFTLKNVAILSSDIPFSQWFEWLQMNTSKGRKGQAGKIADFEDDLQNDIAV